MDYDGDLVLSAEQEMHRYSFCGAFWTDARDNCDTKPHCEEDRDCPEFEYCWTQTPCDYYATAPVTAPTVWDEDYTFGDDQVGWPNGYNATTVPDCVGSTPDFRDSDGDSCRWYEINDWPGCPVFGESFGDSMGTARENCCYCWMDAPTPSPTISTSPTITLTPAPTVCTGSTPNFKDSVGDGCEWYEMFDAPGCPFAGHLFEGVIGVANDHCCYCMMSSSPTPSPPVIEGYEFKGNGFCTSDDDNIDPFDFNFTEGIFFGFNFTLPYSASTLEECASVCAAEHSNDPLFRGFNWVDQFLCFCLKSLEGGAGAGEITGAVNEFGMGNNMQCYAYESVSTES